MKTHLNTLYVTTQGAYLSVDRENVLVNVERKVKLRVPLHMLESIVCFGNVLASPFLLGRCAERDVALAFLTERGRFLARVQGPISGNVLLRREQFRRADDLKCSTALARLFVSAKVHNSRCVLQRARRDRADQGKLLDDAVDDLARTLKDLERAESVEAVRGLEGNAARCYFGVFDCLVTSTSEAFRFERRSRRPPGNPMNALLSFFYVLLLHDVRSALEVVGLDPQVGYLHRDRPGRAGLALDLMEEFRGMIADRLALSLVNRRQVKASGFETHETGGVSMDDATRKTVLVAYQERKTEEIHHPFLEEKTTIGMLVHHQARLLARYLRGDMDGYPPFIWK